MVINMINILTLDPKKCVACKTCEIVCSLVKTGKCNPSESCIKVITFDEEGFYSPTTCFQCKEAWCVKACPAAAISSNEETGARVIDESKCVGCRICTMACPFGQIHISSEGKAKKCDLCNGDSNCAKFCPTQAIKFERFDSSISDKRYSTFKKVMLASQSELEL